MYRLLWLIALTALANLALAQKDDLRPGMVITGDREAPLVLYIVPWAEPRTSAPPEAPQLPLMPKVIDYNGARLVEPASRAASVEKGETGSK